MVDVAFCLGCDCKALALKHNAFMKHGASNFLLGFQLFLSCLSTLVLVQIFLADLILVYWVPRNEGLRA